MMRCGDQRVVQSYKEALADPDKSVDGIVHHRIRGRRQTLAQQKTNRHVARELEDAIRKEICCHLTDGKLLSWARVGAPTVPRTPIPADAWKYLKVSNWKTSVAYHSVGSQKTRYYDLRLFPPLKAPDAAERIMAKGDFIQLFLNFVRCDPEFQAALKQVPLNDTPYCKNLHNAHPRGRLWRVGTTKAEGFWKWRDSHDEPNEDAAGATDEVDALAYFHDGEPRANKIVENILFDRQRAVMDMLRSGRVVAIGQNAKTGEFQPIPQPLWNHFGHAVDVESGEFWAGMPGDEQELLFRNIYFEALTEEPVATNSAPKTGEPQAFPKSKVRARLQEIFAGERQTKRHVRKLVRSEFEGLSGRQFDHHWDELAPDKWKRSGRPRDS